MDSKSLSQEICIILVVYETSMMGSGLALGRTEPRAVRLLATPFLQLCEIYCEGHQSLERSSLEPFGI